MNRSAGKQVILANPRATYHLISNTWSLEMVGGKGKEEEDRVCMVVIVDELVEF